MSAAGVIVRVTLRECLRRRGAGRRRVLTLAFLGALRRRHPPRVRDGRQRAVRQAGTLVDADALAGATLLGLAMFATLFLGAVLAVFLTFNVVRGDAEQGLLQPIVVRPIGRTVFVAARFGAACGICASYTALVYARARRDHRPRGRLVARQHRRARRCARGRGVRDRGDLAAGLGATCRRSRTGSPCS